MRFFKNLSTRSKLLTGYLIISIVLIIIGLKENYTLNFIERGTIDINEISKITHTLSNIKFYTGQNSQTLLKALKQSNQSELENVKVEFAYIVEVFQKYVNELKSKAELESWGKTYYAEKNSIAHHSNQILIIYDREIINHIYIGFNYKESLLRNYKPRLLIDTVIPYANRKHLQENYEKILSEFYGVESQLAASQNKIYTHIQQIDNTIYSISESAIATNNELTRWSKIFTAVVTGISIVLAIIFSLIIGNIISRPIKFVLAYMKELSEGNLSDEVFLNQEDEVGQIAKYANELNQNLRKTRDFAIQVGKGNFDTEITVFGGRGEVGQSLADMRHSLDRVAKDREKSLAEEQIRNWNNRGLSRFASILRRNMDDLQQLAEMVIKHLVKYLNASQGAFFIYGDKESGKTHIELAAVFAYDNLMRLEKSIIQGEGLVGSCAYEKATIFLTDIPKDYIEITSGLGSAQPRSLLLVPIKIDQTVLGVLEIASFTVLKKYEIQFVEQLAENIANTLINLKATQRTERILMQFEMQSSEIAEMEKEMLRLQKQLNNAKDDARVKEADLLKKIKEFKAQLKELNVDIEKIEPNNP